MERCLYCGNLITLTEPVTGQFCTREHQDAHTELQAQAEKRLMIFGSADEQGLERKSAPELPKTALPGDRESLSHRPSTGGLLSEWT
jgi:hypothetical protein